MEDIGNYGYTLFRTQPKGKKKRVQIPKGRALHPFRLKQSRC